MRYIPLGQGQNAMVDDEDYEWLMQYKWYAYHDPRDKATYAAANTPGGRRVLMHNLIMGVDTMEDEPPKRHKRRYRGTT